MFNILADYKNDLPILTIPIAIKLFIQILKHNISLDKIDVELFLGIV